MDRRDAHEVQIVDYKPQAQAMRFSMNFSDSQVFTANQIAMMPALRCSAAAADKTGFRDKLHGSLQIGAGRGGGTG